MSVKVASRNIRIIGAVVATAGTVAIPVIAVPLAGAAPCPDVEVVFARGTTEPPGVGGIGQAFVDSLRSQAGGRSVGVYAVDYPASNDFVQSTPAGGERHERTCAGDGRELSQHQDGAWRILARCRGGGPGHHCHARRCLRQRRGGARSTFADSLSPGPLPSVGPLYRAKTIEMCVPNDPTCYQGGWDMRAHGAYVQTGMVNEAAAFAASRI